jgi:hypothetical protein
MEVHMRRASIADVRNKLSVNWLGDGPFEITANNIVVATVYPSIANEEARPNTDPRVPARTGVAAPTPISPSRTVNSDARVPAQTGAAAPRGLSKSDQASGKSRLRGG